MNNNLNFPANIGVSRMESKRQSAIIRSSLIRGRESSNTIHKPIIDIIAMERWLLLKIVSTTIFVNVYINNLFS